LTKLAITPPISGVVGEEVAIPKIAFQFNEDYLRFAIYQALEQMDIKACLEPRFPIIRLGRRVIDAITGRRYLTDIRTDLLLCDLNCIWEVENFWRSQLDITKHIAEYCSLLGLEGRVITWLREGLEPSEKIVLVNPMTGEFVSKGDILRPSPPPPQELLIKYVTYCDYTLPTGSLHLWLQYELFKFLRDQGLMVSIEVPVGHPSGHVFAPDKMHISLRRGILSWSPEKFTQYSYGAGPIEPAVRFDVVSVRPEDAKEVDIYEVKTLSDFKGRTKRESEKKCWNVLGQLANYIRLGKARRFWLIIHKEPEEFTKMLAEFLKGSKVGLMVYSYPERTFEVLVEPKECEVKGQETMTILVTD